MLTPSCGKNSYFWTLRPRHLVGKTEYLAEYSVFGLPLHKKNMMLCYYVTSIVVYITYSEKDSEKVSSAKVCHPLNLTTSKRLR